MYFGMLQAITEGSTPFVNWRFILIETGKKDSFWYTFASLGMMVSLFLCRMVRCPGIGTLCMIQYPVLMVLKSACSS